MLVWQFSSAYGEVENDARSHLAELKTGEDYVDRGEGLQFVIGLDFAFGGDLKTWIPGTGCRHALAACCIQQLPFAMHHGAHFLPYEEQFSVAVAG